MINEQDRAIATVTRNLILTQTSTSDGARYSCRATNSAMNGMDSDEFELLVQSKDSVWQFSMELTKAENYCKLSIIVEKQLYHFSVLYLKLGNQ